MAPWGRPCAVSFWPQAPTWSVSPTDPYRPQSEDPSSAPQEWTQWQCDQEDALDPVLRTLDVLVLNHGINPQGGQRSEINQAMEINALSSWRLLNRFEAIAISPGGASPPAVGQHLRSRDPASTESWL